MNITLHRRDVQCPVVSLNSKYIEQTIAHTKNNENMMQNFYGTAQKRQPENDKHCISFKFSAKKMLQHKNNIKK